LRTTSKLGLALEVLRDGEWHGMEELQQLLELNQSQAREIVSFLQEYNLAAIDDQNKRVRIQKYFQEFLAQTSTC
jgi:DNA-binding IclR family transcriptional regulator